MSNLPTDGIACEHCGKPCTLVGRGIGWECLNDGCDYRKTPTRADAGQLTAGASNEAQDACIGRAGGFAPEPDGGQAPIARVTVTEGDFASVTLYAPGLPPGAHDLYCAPLPSGDWPTELEASRRVGAMALGAAGQHAERVIELEGALIHAAKHILELHHSISRRVYESEERDRSDAFEGIGDGQFNGDWASICQIMDDALCLSTTKSGVVQEVIDSVRCEKCGAHKDQPCPNHECPQKAMGNRLDPKMVEATNALSAWACTTTRSWT
jgi:hypothetical protein